MPPHTVVCPVPDRPSDGDYTERFLDVHRALRAITEGQLRFDEPCAVLVAFRNREDLLEEVAADPAAADRLYLYTYTEDPLGGDPRELPWEQFAGPVLGRDADNTRRAECWYRIAEVRPLVERFPDAVLAAACTTGDDKAFAAAIEAGADVEWTDAWPRQSAMGRAIEAERLDLIERLIAAGWRGTNWGRDESALAPAIDAGNEAIVARIREVWTGAGTPRPPLSNASGVARNEAEAAALAAPATRSAQSVSAHSATDADVPSGGPASSTEDDGHRTIAAGICLGSIGLFILIATDWFVAGISLAFLGFVLAFGARQQRADAAVKREASDT